MGGFLLLDGDSGTLSSSRASVSVSQCPFTMLRQSRILVTSERRSLLCGENGIADPVEVGEKALTPSEGPENWHCDDYSKGLGKDAAHMKMRFWCP